MNTLHRVYVEPGRAILSHLIAPGLRKSEAALLWFLFFLKEEEAWRRGCDAGSHTHGREFEPHRGIYLYVFRFL